MQMIFHAHSGLRYLVLLAGVVALLLALFGWARGRPFGRAGRIAGAVFVGVLDLQVLLGLVTLLARPFYGALIGHIVLMLLAAIAAHVAQRLARVRAARRPGQALEGAPPSGRPAWASQAVGFAVALASIVLGILAIGRAIV